MRLISLCLAIFLSAVLCRPLEEVCLFIGYTSDHRGARDTKFTFKPDHNYLKVSVDSARTTSFWFEIENTKANPYFLRYRSHPFTGSLLRGGNQVIAVDSMGRGEVFARDGDIVVIRVPMAQDREFSWPSMETDLFQYYDSIDLLRLSAWEERKLRSLVRRSSAIVVARVSCISTVQLFPFISSSDDVFDDPSLTSTGFSAGDYTSDTRDYTSDTRDSTCSTD